MKFRILTISGALFFLSAAIQAVLPSTAPAASRRGTDVQVYSLQILINQAYQMALEGSGLVMLDQMGKGGVFGDMIGNRGRTMMDHGKKIIEDALQGQEMKQLARSGRTDDPLMIAVQENARIMLESIDRIKAYLMMDTTEPQLSDMHSLTILLNHGMKMATDGANMIMLGRSGRSGKAKETLQRHGRNMMQDGRVFIIRLSDHETMKSLHTEGFTAERSAAMRSLHSSIEAALKMIDRLARM